ncbi:helix-turn-helix transcriptional regulator [Ralstonia solanacearum]|uniref:helix-turn-helix transcriptional regulator n=1 Tax=Ralstonia solanacearum TaxID=305 RepID=UPI0009EBFDF2|nr:AlpA family phage regulatory protein [Ralstonia solanacearum]AXV85627.1 AlpA family phage regulatory protein [Ralstonia solanacearum]AXW05136.1 AlpA family phage regulatory protein [Ralstonia solanacearum]AXW22880.1 AlpA family phage regulatory protein [Ralstonia solanacearum]AXW79827.1 AlpA family phage regulatory protein [Ralstonia solanacearum]
MATQHQIAPDRRTDKSRSNPTGSLPETGYVRQSQLILAVLPFSGTTLWRKVKDGSFPPPTKLSPRVTAWRVEDVREYLDNPASYRARSPE